MKTLLLALVTLIIVSCNLNQNRINENDVSDASSNIDTVFIKDSVIEKYNYEIVESFYPQIRILFQSDMDDYRSYMIAEVLYKNHFSN